MGYAFPNKNYLDNLKFSIAINYVPLMLSGTVIPPIHT